jgi:uncharacterized membrane protein
MKRVLRHLFSDQFSVRRAFPAAAMDRITGAIARGEERHDGELRFAVEASLPLSYLLSGKSARDRAIDVFSQLRVWDTEHNSGVLIYVLLADRRVEIVADRGINAKVEDGAWKSICAQMQQAFGARRFEDGAVAGIAAISDLLAQHFPAGSSNPNELPDEPVVL